jgi:16S rRNA (cytidine1402-2'-O)-methyltransferase
MSEDPKFSARKPRSKSEQALAAGLYLVATPIGNARDITLRALDVLQSADRLYAEDTRVTAKLLALHAISRPLQSYREHNASTHDDRIVNELQQGLSVALVSDAGSPLISDPGQSLVERVLDSGVPVIPVPGPSAVIAALTASGLPADRFLFAGFLASKPNERRREIRALETVPATLVLFEAPSRLVETLSDLQAILGNRMACVAREITKLHEDIRRCPLNALIAHYEAEPQVRGEIVILVSPPALQEAATMTSDNEARLDARLMATMHDHPVKEAAAIVAAEFGLPRRSVYARALVLKKSDESST